MVLECCRRPSQIGPHQVTYEVAAWPIHIVRYDMVLECCRRPHHIALGKTPTRLQHGRYTYKELK
eukprot:scaffold14945_cov82-Skeletonema_dohrnii-CCMP3373.AAC.2